MAYSIIPPIIVVLCLAGIILFLLKKAPYVARIEDKNAKSKKSDWFSGKSTEKAKKPERKKWKQRLLLALEKITRRFKVMFLKLENTFTAWNESIKIKRKSHQADKANEVLPERAVSGAAEPQIINLRKDDIGAFSRAGEKMEMPPDEKIYRPIISDKITLPRQIRKKESKDQLEQILIERIAANPKDTEAYERLGEYYFEVGNYSYAKECVKQVVKLDPANREAKGLMRRLERLLMRR